MAFVMERLTDEDEKFLNSFKIYNYQRGCINTSWYHNSELLADKEREIYFIYIDGSGNLEQCPHHYALIWKGTVIEMYRDNYEFDDWYVDAPYELNFCKEELYELLNEVLDEYYDRIYNSERHQDEKRLAKKIVVKFMMKRSVLIFLHNARLLSETFGITPFLCDSLEPECLTDENPNADDIDILIPEEYIADRWEEFKATLQKKRFELTDEQEHTFCKDNIYYSYASIEKFEKRAGISISEIEAKSEVGKKFGLLSLQECLSVNKKFSENRIFVRGKKDEEKSEFIRNEIITEKIQTNQHHLRDILLAFAVRIPFFIGLVLVALLVVGVLLVLLLQKNMENSTLAVGFALSAIIVIIFLVGYSKKLKKKDKK